MTRFLNSIQQFSHSFNSKLLYISLVSVDTYLTENIVFVIFEVWKFEVHIKYIEK